MNLKEKLRIGELTIGSWITLAHPAIAEIMARAGFDWLVVDLEHSVITIREAEELIRVIDLCGVVPLVRLSANDPVQIKRVMDAGAHGVIVPMVNTKDDAIKAVSAVRYPPIGTRGVGLARAQKYGTGFDDYKKWLEEESVIIVQIEHIDGVENFESILKVECVDGFIVGPYDLSGSLGIPGQFDHPKYRQVIKRLEKQARDMNFMAGYHIVLPEPDQVLEKAAQGYKFIAYSTDFLFLGEKCRRDLSKIRQSINFRNK